MPQQEHVLHRPTEHDFSSSLVYWRDFENKGCVARQLTREGQIRPWCSISAAPYCSHLLSYPSNHGPFLCPRRQSSRCGQPRGGGGVDSTETGKGFVRENDGDIIKSSSGGGSGGGSQACNATDADDDHGTPRCSVQAGGDEFTLLHLKDGGVFPPQSGLVVKKDKGDFDQVRHNRNTSPARYLSKKVLAYPEETRLHTRGHRSMRCTFVPPKTFLAKDGCARTRLRKRETYRKPTTPSSQPCG